MRIGMRIRNYNLRVVIIIILVLVLLAMRLRMMGAPPWVATRMWPWHRGLLLYFLVFLYNSLSSASAL
jgi:hypothetical protein